MKVLVCGGRYYAEVEMLHAILDTINFVRPISHLVSGDANGADRLALDWAREVGIGTSTHYADWDKYGKAAGPIRNQEMLSTHPDIELVIAFPGKQGTRDMISRVSKAGIRILAI